MRIVNYSEDRLIRVRVSHSSTLLVILINEPNRLFRTYKSYDSVQTSNIQSKQGLC